MNNQDIRDTVFYKKILSDDEYAMESKLEEYKNRCAITIVQGAMNHKLRTIILSPETVEMILSQLDHIRNTPTTVFFSVFYAPDHYFIKLVWSLNLSCEFFTELSLTKTSYIHSTALASQKEIRAGAYTLIKFDNEAQSAVFKYAE